MTERKPPGVNFESWVDKQISEAMNRGAFDDLPGAGEPIRNLDRPYDEVWVNRLLQDEGATPEDMLPTPLRLRREAERLPEKVRGLGSERAVRDEAEELNDRITAWLRAPLDGPTVPVRRVDVDAIVAQWRAERKAGTKVAGPSVPARRSAPLEESQPEQVTRPSWWRRLTHRG